MTIVATKAKGCPESRLNIFAAPITWLRVRQTVPEISPNSDSRLTSIPYKKMPPLSRGHLLIHLGVDLKSS